MPCPIIQKVKHGTETATNKLHTLSLLLIFRRVEQSSTARHPHGFTRNPSQPTAKLVPTANFVATDATELGDSTGEYDGA